MRPADRSQQGRRKRGLVFGGAGIALLFVPAIIIVLSPGFGLYAIAAMIVGIVFLIAGFVTLPGSLASMLRPKP